jgi:hypothetical protein
MNGIYLTEEGKKEIEAKIDEIEKQLNSPSHFPMALSGKLLCLKEILSSAIILPVEESWNKVDEKSDYGLSSEEFYPQGVVIQPKQ